MTAAFLRIPIEFERMAPVRLFARKLCAADPSLLMEQAILMSIRVWIDFAIAQSDWRALKTRNYSANGEPIWASEDLTYVIEGACGWKGAPGVLIKAGIKSEFLVLEERENKPGLALRGFFPLNEHVSPEFKTIQQRGGMARSQALLRAQDETLAKQQQEIHRSQGILPFETEKLTQKGEQACYTLVIRITRACGLPISTTPSDRILRAALPIVTDYSPEQIDSVEGYLVDSRQNPQVIKDPLKVLENFSDYLK